MTRATVFTESEATICVAARLIENNCVCWPILSGQGRFCVLLAEKLYAPGLTHITEDGFIGICPKLPCDPFMYAITSRGNYKAFAWKTMNTACAHASVGMVDYAFLGALQIDPYGNVNSSMLGGDYYHPERRFGGAGGANEMASLAWRTVYLTTQEPKKFVKKLDFISSPGYLDGTPGAREKAGLPANTGPYRVVTPDALFGFDEETHYMKLLAIAEWVTVDSVLKKMEFEPIVPDNVEKLEPPRDEELMVLRIDIDPRGQTISEGKWIELPDATEEV